MPEPSKHLPLAGSERPRPATHALVGPADANEEIGIQLVVRARPGSPPLPDLDYWRATPLGKRRFLTPDEYTRIYGATQADLDAVTAFAAARGLTVIESHAGRRSVTLKGTAAQLNETFGITLNYYEGPLPGAAPRNRVNDAAARMQKHRGYDGPVHLPSRLIGIVLGVYGLDNRCIGVPAIGSGVPPGSVVPPLPASTVAQFYKFPNITGAQDQTIGIPAFSFPNANPPQFAGYLQSDINNYFQNSTSPILNPVSLTVGVNSYTNNTASVSSSNTSALEITADIEISATIAQGATVNVYFTEVSELGWIVFLNRILIPEDERQPTVVTISAGLPESDPSIGSLNNTASFVYQTNTILGQLALLGINVFVASGDWGSNDNASQPPNPPNPYTNDGMAHVDYPGSSPWVTSVGGTVIVSSPTAAEFVWSNCGSTNDPSESGWLGATGGGASTIFPTPSYQTDAGITQIVDSKGSITTNQRFIPDIAGMVGYSIYFAGSSTGFIGTSGSTPLYAGLWAVLQSIFGQQLFDCNSIIYQLGSSILTSNVTASGNNDPSDGTNAPYYTATPPQGWNPCIGWGSIDGTKLLTAIAKMLYPPAFYFQVNKSTYGLDEVKDNLSQVTGSSTYNNAFSLVLEGFTPDFVNSLTPPTLGGDFATLISAISTDTFITINPPQPELSNLNSTPQRIFYPCNVAFPEIAINALSQGGVFPDANALSLLLTAAIDITGQSLPPASAEFELAPGADPYFANFTSLNPQSQLQNVFYLSNDLRVFTVTPAINDTPLAGVTLSPTTTPDQPDTAAGYTYIKNLLNALNSPPYNAPGGTDPFTLLPDQSSALRGDSSVTPTTIDPSSGNPLANYNFAIARVRLTDTPNTQTPSNVRVFFRLFVTQTSHTDFNPDSYPSALDNAGQPGSPSVGVDNVTIPFYATGNYEPNSDFTVNNDYPSTGTSVNCQPITVPAGGTAWQYYGCYLNIYPDSKKPNTINGQPIQSLLTGTHNCIVAQIAYDDAPIPTSGAPVGPENSDKLAQRNLQITLSDNPGPSSTHRIPQTFDVRPSPAIATTPGDIASYPDELMIDWGNTPAGSTASIYWPQVKVADVLALAKKIYSTHQLSAADANTVQCKVPQGGFTYVPIPPGSGMNFAGLFTVDLPSGVRTGQVFTIVVRAIATWRPEVNDATFRSQRRVSASVPASERAVRTWRYVIGSFAVRIPVTTARIMLPLEENTLAIMKWRLGLMSPSSRWYPVLQRYISYIAGRVDGLGGNSGAIQPSPWGAPPPKVIAYGGDTKEFTGKVREVIFDCFGELEGFVLETCSSNHHFMVTEKTIGELVLRACRERLTLSVIVEHAQKVGKLIVRA